MKAKDTVMNNPELEAVVKRCHDGSNELLYAHDLFIAQAEISFKAGYEQAERDRLDDNDNMERAKESIVF